MLVAIDIAHWASVKIAGNDIEITSSNGFTSFKHHFDLPIRYAFILDI
jgi:hypothetical protein